MKIIVGYDQPYRVTTEGEVLNRHLRSLKVKTTNCGYTSVGIYQDGKQKWRSVHRLVAEAFIPNPYNLPEVNHINGDKTDNRVENLEWTSRSRNEVHAYDTGLAASGEEHYKAKLTREAVHDILLNYRPRSVPMRHFAEKYEVSVAAVGKVLEGKNWTRVAAELGA